MRFNFKKPEAIFYRLVSLILGALIFFVPLFFTFNRKDYFADSAKSVQQYSLVEKKKYKELGGEPKLVYSSSNNSAFQSIKTKIESHGIDIYVEDKYSTFWIYVNKTFLYRAKLLINPNLLDEELAKYENYAAIDSDKYLALISGWDLVDAYDELGRYEEAIEILNDIDNKNLIDMGQRARFDITRKRLETKQADAKRKGR